MRDVCRDGSATSFIYGNDNRGNAGHCLPSLAMVCDGPQDRLRNRRGEKLLQRLGGEMGKVVDEALSKGMARVHVDVEGPEEVVEGGRTLVRRRCRHGGAALSVFPTEARPSTNNSFRRWRGSRVRVQVLAVAAAVVVSFHGRAGMSRGVGEDVDVDADAAWCLYARRPVSVRHEVRAVGDAETRKLP